MGSWSPSGVLSIQLGKGRECRDRNHKKGNVEGEGGEEEVFGEQNTGTILGGQKDKVKEGGLGGTHVWGVVQGNGDLKKTGQIGVSCLGGKKDPVKIELRE